MRTYSTRLHRQCVSAGHGIEAHERTEATKRIVLVLIKSIIVDMYKIHDHVARYDRFFWRMDSMNYENRIK
jgi:hypothetical protein